MTIEICTNSFRSAKIAARSGIDRVEICQSLESGGITPSAGDIRLTVGLKAQFDFKVYVLIRPRGGDFCFNSEEYEVMRQDILFCKENGVDGVVLGGLKLNGHIDTEGMKSLAEAAQGMGMTFHRAFDYVNDPFQAMEEIIDLGFERILTSGQKNTAIEGKEILKQLIEIADGRISIMPGSGVNEKNIKDLIDYTGAKEIHFSAKETIRSLFEGKSEAKIEADYWLTSGGRIAEVRAGIKESEV